MDNSAANSLYDLLVTRDFEPEILDASGKSITDPAEAELFSFDYKTDEKNYGTVVVLLGADNDLEVYFGDNLGRSMEGDDKKQWYDFLAQLKAFATRNMLNFNLQNLNRLKYTMQGMAAIKEGLFEGYYGSRKISYSDQPKKTRLVIKHDRPLGEGDARFRNIDSLYVETENGERFKVPSRSLTHGRIIARHCAEGGNPYDAFGQHIGQVVAELNTLGRFVRAAKHKGFSGDAGAMVEAAVKHYGALKSKAKHMISRRGYLEARDAFDPAAFTETEDVAESIRNMFIEQSLDQRIEEALPILARLAEEENKMKEANEFECWTNNVMEGTWSLPDTPEAKKQLQDLMSKELPVGPDATNATEQLYDIFGDDQLFDQLEELALLDPDADARPAIQQRAEELGIDLVLTPADAQTPSPDAEVDESLMGAPIGGVMPMKTDEAGRGRPRKDGEIDNRDDGLPRIGRIEKTDTGLKHYARQERGGTIPEPDHLNSLNKSMTSRLDQAFGVNYRHGEKNRIEVDESSARYQMVKQPMGSEGPIVELPNDFDIRNLPGAQDALRRYSGDEYSDTLYFKDPISGGVFSFYLAFGAPRIRSVGGSIDAARMEEISQSLGQGMREALDTDGVMMCKPSNMSSESRTHDEVNRLIELARV